MFLEGSAGISVCSPGRQGQKNSSWQQCFNGWLQGRRQAERKLFRIQIISQQIHVNFYQDKRPPAHFCPGFCKNHFWLQGVFRLQPILSFVQRETPLRGFYLFRFWHSLHLTWIKTQTIFSKIFHLRKLLVVVKVSGVNLWQRNHQQSTYINILKYI